MLEISMAKEEIRNFIRFNRNIPLFKVRQIFLQRGFPSQEIDEVISEFMPNSQIHNETKIHSLWFIIPGLIALLIVIFLLVFFLRAGKPEQLLDLKILSIDDKIQQGDDLNFNIEVLNLGTQKQYDISLTYDVLDMQNQYYPRLRTERTVAIQDKSEFPGKIEKINLKPGDYKFSVTARYSNQVATASQVFEVAKKENLSEEADNNQEQEIKEANQENQNQQSSSEDCGNCNDNNKCTKDLCDSGLCVNEIIENCCGNNLCESGESSGSCSADCVQKITGYSDDELEEKALSISSSNPTEAIRYCLSISIQDNINYCLNVCADKSKKQEFCSKMQNSDMKDNCYMTLAINGNKDLCKFIVNGYKKNTCLALT